MSQRMMKDEDFKVTIASCNECGKEFKMRIPIQMRDTMVAAAEDGEMSVFVGPCPDCQERDPFLKLLKEAGITTVGGLSRRIER